MVRWDRVPEERRLEAQPYLRCRRLNVQHVERLEVLMPRRRITANLPTGRYDLRFQNRFGCSDFLLICMILTNNRTDAASIDRSVPTWIWEPQTFVPAATGLEHKVHNYKCQHLLRIVCYFYLRSNVPANSAASFSM